MALAGSSEYRHRAWLALLVEPGPQLVHLPEGVGHGLCLFHRGIRFLCRHRKIEVEDLKLKEELLNFPSFVGYRNAKKLRNNTGRVTAPLPLLRNKSFLSTGF